jgi:integrase
VNFREFLRQSIVDSKWLVLNAPIVAGFKRPLTPKEPLLMSERGKRFIYMSLYSKIKKIGKKAGIGKLHPHMLRHTYLVRLYNVEHDLRFVQDQAGHASPTTTAVYAKTNSAARKRQVQALDDEDF